MQYDKKVALYRKMYTIRIFEQKLLELFSEGRLSGTTHTYQGEEAIAVAALDHLQEGDGVFSNHRCHGHYIAYGGDIEKLFAEIMGKADGVCAGRGGSQHLCYGHFYTNGIQGGMLPCAAGFAYASKLREESPITVAFIGDGTMGEGIVYETLNMASLWDLPLLIVVEDNGYAQTTPKNMNCAGEIADRFRAFQIKTLEKESNDFEELYALFDEAFHYVRQERKPCCCVIHTYRLGPHSKGDDFREQKEIEAWRKKDPLCFAERKLDEADIARVQSEVHEDINLCVEQASRSSIEPLETISNGISRIHTECTLTTVFTGTSEDIKYFESINQALKQILTAHKEALIIGEDILDPYGGSFKVTKGLSSEFPEQVISTPISEAGFAGIANGLALHDMHPIVEVMFADFSTLIYDQVLNHGAKFKWMYNNQVNIPVIYRLPTGGRRGYGATHSQSPEKIFFGLPNVTVVAPTHYHNPGQIMINLYDRAESPVMVIENKALYTEKLVPNKNGIAGKFAYASVNAFLPTLRLAPDRKEAEATIICYGGGLTTALEASWNLMIEDEMNVEVICPALISPVPEDDILGFISKASKKVVVLDESFADFGWSADIAYKIERYNRKNQRSCAVKCMGAQYTYLSACKPLEQAVFPSPQQIMDELRKDD